MNYEKKSNVILPLMLVGCLILFRALIKTLSNGRKTIFEFARKSHEVDVTIMRFATEMLFHLKL